MDMGSCISARSSIKEATSYFTITCEHLPVFAEIKLKIEEKNIL